MIRCAFVEWPDGLQPGDGDWRSIAREIQDARPDMLVTNEMPFGTWLANTTVLDADRANDSIDLHDKGLEALSSLAVATVISSRPRWVGQKLVNEAFALCYGKAVPLHSKQFFPEEEGWYEATWFRPDHGGFVVHELNGLKVGVLLCTELMFNEQARRYGRAGADLIVVPRATGLEQHKWSIAGAMAAIVSGCYVVSSNRVGAVAGSPVFGGRGMAFSPDGSLLAETSSGHPLAIIDVDAEASQRQKQSYPCYVREYP